MIEVIGLAAGVTALVCAFGLPAVLWLCPERWRPWWPALLPAAGLATLAVLLQPVATLLPTSTAIWISLPVAVALTAWALVKGRRPPRPSTASLVAVAVCVVAGGLAYAPTLRYEVPLAPGIVNNDAIYYLSVDEWLLDNPAGERPPPPDADGFYAPAHELFDKNLRIGVDLTNAASATVLGTDPGRTLPALIFLLIAAGGLAGALLLVTLGAPGWLTAIGATAIALRPETIRIGLDAYVAQAAGLVLAPAAIAAVWLALSRGGRREIGMAALLSAGLIAHYTEYAPFLVLAGGVMLAAGLVLRDGVDLPLDRGELLKRAAVLAGLAAVLDPVALVRGVQGLVTASELGGAVIVPFYGAGKDVAYVLGPFSVVREVNALALVVAGAAAILAVLGALTLRRGPAVLLWSSVAAAGALIAHQAWISPYSYGLTKVLSLMAPFALAALVLVLRRRGPRLELLAAALAVLALVGLNARSSAEITRQSLSAQNGMLPVDVELERLAERLPFDDEPVALENTDLDGAPDARQHYSVYVLRERVGLPVVYSRGPGSYYTLALKRGPADVDRTYRPDYEAVISWGPSLTHDDPIAQAGNYAAYRRQEVDPLLSGRDWVFVTEGPEGPMRWTRGSGIVWLSSERPARVRLVLRMLAPKGTVPFRLLHEGRTVVAEERLKAGPVTEVVSEPFDVPAGRTYVSVDSEPVSMFEGDPNPLGVGLQELDVEVLDDVASSR